MEPEVTRKDEGSACSRYSVDTWTWKRLPAYVRTKADELVGSTKEYLIAGPHGYYSANSSEPFSISDPQ